MGLRAKVHENDNFLDNLHYVLYHTWNLSHFLLDITETFYCRSAVIDKIINAQTAEIFRLVSLLYNLIGSAYLRLKQSFFNGIEGVD